MMPRLFALLTALFLTLPASAADDDERLVVIGGAVTEVVYALGHGDDVVAVDSSSSYPAATEDLPKVGFFRQLSAEGVLSMRPTRVLASASAGPDAALDQLRAAGVDVVQLPETADVDGAKAMWTAVGEALGAEEQAAALTAGLDRTLAALDRPEPAPRVMFVYARGGGHLVVAGTDTSASSIIRLAGGVPAVDAWSGYRPLTAEAVVGAAPDVILLTDEGLEHLGGVDGAVGLPGVSLTPAGKDRRVIAMDTLYLLGFGARLGDAATELAAALKGSK